jgi:RNA polymerase sigma-70 factor (ECF subfamily)
MSEAGAEYETRPSLLLRVRDAADQEAWQRFARAYGGLIYGECRRRGLRDADAEDVTQQVFSRIFQALRSFEYRPERGRFRDWLATIVRNEVYRFLKSRAGVPMHSEAALDELEQADAGWEERFMGHLLSVALEECRPHFEPRTWAAFQGVWVEHRPAPEVGRELGLPVESVYVAKSRVLKRLAAVVEELTNDLPVPG